MSLLACLMATLFYCIIIIIPCAVQSRDNVLAHRCSQWHDFRPCRVPHLACLWEFKASWVDLGLDLSLSSSPSWFLEYVFL